MKKSFEGYVDYVIFNCVSLISFNDQHRNSAAQHCYEASSSIIPEISGN